MAIIRFGPMVADARGSVGGTVFARNSAGAYTRNRTKPVYPGSERQTTRAAQMSQIVETWQETLTVEQRNAWSAKAPTNGLTNRVGDRMTGSGFNLYARANLLLLISAQTPVVPPPTPLTRDAPIFTIGWTDGLGIQVTNVHGWAPAYTDKVIIQRITKLRQSVNFYKGPWAYLFSDTGANVRTVPYTLNADTGLLSDTRAFYRFRVIVDDGSMSQPWIQRADVGTITP